MTHMDFSKLTVLCLGDVMLDRYRYGEMERISPEAPVPVLRLTQTQEMAGGAGNVASNIVSLGGKVVLIGLIGEDETAHLLHKILSKKPAITDALVSSRQRPSICKTRFIASHQQVVRADEETTHPAIKEEEDALISTIRKYMNKVQVVIISDYDKGVCTPAVLKEVIQEARKNNITVFVDPKRTDYSRYKGAFCITPNMKELMGATPHFERDEKGIEQSARFLIEQTQAQALLVTRSEKGMMLVEQQGDIYKVPARAREVYDVSGAGDTVIATLALAYASGFSLVQAMHIANAAAGVVVGKLGTATADIAEVQAELSAQDEHAHFTFENDSAPFFPSDKLKQQVVKWKNQGHVVGFTNGCFDILHPGHVSLLRQAKSQCDKLIVAINTDESIKRLKGKSRPVNFLSARAEILAALRYVDVVTSFSEDTPLALITDLLPDILIKGEDYKVKDVVGADIIIKNGGKVFLAALSQGYSTTSIIERARVNSV